MRLVYKFNIGQSENISSLCKISNNLYNQALYIFRETLSKEDKWLSYFELDDIMKNTKNLDGDINYRLLKAQCSQQVLRILDKNIKSYYKSVGKLINADINGALNIMRKVVGDSCESVCRIIDRGLLFNPVRIMNVFC
jgi:transposase